MEPLLGTSFGVFLGVTVVVMGFAAFMTGQALAATWNPVWKAVLYTLLLGFADRFLGYALFEGELLSSSGYLIDTAVLVAITLVAYRLKQARMMVTQYPWLYVRTGPFGWQERGQLED
jgi:ABC-type uncharacterized transport system permease subunit